MKKVNKKKRQEEENEEEEDKQQARLQIFYIQLILSLTTYCTQCLI